MPVYLALKRLIRDEWSTKLRGETDGRFGLSGFYSEYRVKIEQEEKPSNKPFALKMKTGSFRSRSHDSTFYRCLIRCLS
jgi:hypothetical protein